MYYVAYIMSVKVSVIDDTFCSFAIGSFLKPLHLK